MQKATFTAYAVPAPGYMPGPQVPDHTFVVSTLSNMVLTDNVLDNWNCWGRGKETINNGARQISQGSALAEWAGRIYGTDPNFPTGLLQKVEGVCQNACNRLLVLAGVDVAEANANVLTILLYGKYGYHLEDFVNNVKAAAAAINQQQPNTILPADLQQVLDRIANDPADELGTLEEHFQSAPTVGALSSSQKDQLLGIYREFQLNRQNLFNAQWPNRNDQNFQANYAKALLPDFLQCLKECSPILGIDVKTLEQQVPYLLNTQ